MTKSPIFDLGDCKRIIMGYVLLPEGGTSTIMHMAWENWDGSRHCRSRFSDGAGNKDVVEISTEGKTDDELIAVGKEMIGEFQRALRVSVAVYKEGCSPKAFADALKQSNIALPLSPF